MHLFVCFSSNTEKDKCISARDFLIKAACHIRHCGCSVKSPAFRTCQNYCVCTAVLLNIVQNAWKSACPGFLKVQTQIRAVGHLQQGALQEFHILFGIFAFWLFWKHEIEGQGHCYGFNCLLASAKNTHFCLCISSTHKGQSLRHSQTHCIQVILLSLLEHLFICGPARFH